MSLEAAASQCFETIEMRITWSLGVHIIGVLVSDGDPVMSLVLPC